MSQVYFLKTDQDSLDFNQSLTKITDKIRQQFGAKDDLAIKLHFGERNSDTHLDPDLVKAIYQQLETKVNQAALMDCNVLYKSERSFGPSHRKLARDKGYTFAPVVIADGDESNNELLVEINQQHFDQVRLGGALRDYNAFLSIAHFTGHGANGIGGALKNVGMGLGSKAGKMEMHEAFELKVNRSSCQACRKCIQECPAGAISLVDGRASIDHEACTGCAHCIAICPSNAIKIPWSAGSARNLQERIDEYAYGVLKDRKSYFVNVLFDITPECDCIQQKQQPMVDDLGILASQDIVAIDQASLDLIGKERFVNSIDHEHQMEYAEKLGMGERDYVLVEL